MKAELIKPEQTFNPVTIQITFETQEELKLFIEAMKYNSNWYRSTNNNMHQIFNTVANTLLP